MQGSRGRKKKRLQTNEAEAQIVTLIYNLYLHGIEGKRLGFKEIGKHLTAKGILARGKPWRLQQIHRILSDTLYAGEQYFNVTDSKTMKKRPRAEWVVTAVPTIVDMATYEKIRVLRESRSPEKVSPSTLNSPNLITWLLKCKVCGRGLTVATGKSGKYKYYKCTSRTTKGNHACSSKNYPMATLDNAILKMLAEKVLTDSYIQKILGQLRQNAKSTKDDQQQRINALMAQMKQLEARRANLIDAIETGVIDMDLIQNRAQQIKAAIEALHIEIAGARRTTSLPLDYLKPSKIETIA